MWFSFGFGRTNLWGICWWREYNVVEDIVFFFFIRQSKKDILLTLNLSIIQAALRSGLPDLLDIVKGKPAFLVFLALELWFWGWNQNIHEEFVVHFSEDFAVEAEDKFAGSFFIMWLFIFLSSFLFRRSFFPLRSGLFLADLPLVFYVLASELF